MISPDSAPPSTSAVPNVIGEVLVSARPLSEYTAMFDLTDTDRRQSILDCPGGAASFTAEVNAGGGDVTACDPVYGAYSGQELARHAEAETRRGNAYVCAHPDEYVWSFFADADDHLHRRSQAGGLFARDREMHPQRYVPGALPRLPFGDESFGLVLSSHLRFSYADRLDFAFHLSAVRELMRVARGEVRIFPLVAMGIHSYGNLDELRARLLDDGIATAIRTVAYEFQRGANQLFTCRRVER